MNIFDWPPVTYLVYDIYIYKRSVYGDISSGITCILSCSHCYYSWCCCCCCCYLVSCITCIPWYSFFLCMISLYTYLSRQYLLVCLFACFTAYCVKFSFIHFAFLEFKFFVFPRKLFHYLKFFNLYNLILVTFICFSFL